MSINDLECVKVYGELLTFSYDDNNNIKIIATDFHNKEPNEDGHYDCNICNKIYVKKDYWIDHMKSHENITYTCTICNKTFTHKQHLIQHSAIHKDAQFECNICGLKMNYKVNLKKHKKTHTKYYNDGKVYYLN